MANDWIKVHRSLMDSAVWSDEWLVKLWLWCLLKANYGDAVFRGTLVKRGQFATGRNTAADELHVSPSKWYRGMMRLAELGNIEIHANSVWTMVTVCNYSTYQDATGDKRTAFGQRLNSERTADDTTNGQPADTREEGKKVRMEEGKKNTFVSPMATHEDEDDVEWNGPHNLDPHPVPNGKPRKPSPYSPEFERFWSVYPPYRRTAKGAAWKVWQVALRLIDADTLIRRATEYAASPRGQSDYAKMPATWLNGRCWEDSGPAWGVTAPAGPNGAETDIPF